MLHFQKLWKKVPVFSKAQQAAKRRTLVVLLGGGVFLSVVLIAHSYYEELEYLFICLEDVFNLSFSELPAHILHPFFFSVC